MRTRYLRPWILYLITHSTFTFAVQIGFQTESQSPREKFTFQEAWPEGRSCYLIKTNPKDPITSINVRTTHTDIQTKKTPEAIGFFEGKKCSLETLRFVVFYYQPHEDAVEQRFDLDELPALFRGFNRYREIKDGTLEWFNLLSKAIKDGNSLNEGDVVYQLTDGTWDTLSNVVEVTDITSINNPSPEPYDWYLTRGLRQSTLRKGNYLGHFRNQPSTDFMRSRTADIERDEAQEIIRSKSRKQWRKYTADSYDPIEDFRITPSPIEIFSRSRISEVGSPYFPGLSRKGLSPLLNIPTTDEGNIDPEDATEWDEEPKLEGRVSIPQMSTMNRIMPYLPRTLQGSPQGSNSQNEYSNENIIPADIYSGRAPSQSQNEDHNQIIIDSASKISSGRSRKNLPTRRNIYSSEYYGMPLKWSTFKSYDTAQTLKEEEFEQTPINMDKTSGFGRMAAAGGFYDDGYDDDLFKLDQESRDRISTFAKYTGPNYIQKKAPK
ncbi:hypothetical protein TWF718_002428 [Orbilia javanica]|uniref:Uncharacterized protein n=1 Tax=Orbilia javanica TaxID=47235 RepID=A0AAN8RCD2_9PEZI